LVAEGWLGGWVAVRGWVALSSKLRGNFELGCGFELGEALSWVRGDGAGQSWAELKAGLQL